MRLFRFRSADRDRASDQGRVETIRVAVEASIASAERELTGLRTRYKTASEAAALLTGTDMSDVADRGPAENAALVDAERNLLSAEGRLRTLESHLEDLRKVATFIDSCFAKST